MSTPLPNAPEKHREEENTVVVRPGWLSGSDSMFGAPTKQGRRAAGAVGSLVAHGLLVLILAFLFSRTPPPDRVVESPPLLTTMVYLEEAGPGGGGGGSPEPAPPAPLEIPKTEPPPVAPIVPPPPEVVTPPPPPTLSVPIMTLNAEVAQASGTTGLDMVERGGGGRGTGLGSGTGSGVGPGQGGNFGGGINRGGAGITNPQVVRELKPNYTSEAMRARIQGTVELEAVILEDGTVGDVRVSRSLDNTYGLDMEAVKAAKLWIFRPATDRQGRPVPIVVTLILTFQLH